MRANLFSRLRRLMAAGAVLLGASIARADLAPFTEGFGTGNSNWADGGGLPLDWLASGGPGGAGDGYVTTDRNFVNTIEGDRITLFRGEVGLGASGGAFAGDWLDGRVSEFSFFIRHDFATPLFFFTRFAGPGNSPAVIGLNFTPVMSGEWTEITIEIDPMSPLLIEEGPPGMGIYDATFANVGNLQIGLEVPAALAGFPLDVTFDLDFVSIVPAPGALALLGFAGIGLRRRRRR